MIYPKGTLIKHKKKGKTEVADGTTDYSSSAWSIVSKEETENSYQEGKKEGKTYNDSQDNDERTGKRKIEDESEPERKPDQTKKRVNNSVSFPTTNLQPGSSGSSVKQLQDYLVANGYMTQAQVNTGYGTYGPRTTAAVKKLQEDLGVDNSTGPGYFGPRTIAAIQRTSDQGSEETFDDPEDAGDPQDQEEENNLDWLDEDEDYNSLTDDDKDFIKKYAETLEDNDEENQKLLAQALEDAKAQADPYFKEKIRIVQDELLSSLGGLKGDFTSQKKRLETRIEEIKQDLKTGKERLTIDEQSDLATQARKAQSQLDNLMENVSATGLTFSTKRTLAESELAAENKDVVESTQRSFQRQREDLQLQADRGNKEAQQLLEDYDRKFGESANKLVRSAESYVGTENLPDLEGFGASPLGGITGSIESEKLSDINARAEALLALRNPFL